MPTSLACATSSNMSRFVARSAANVLGEVCACVQRVQAIHLTSIRLVKKLHAVMMRNVQLAVQGGDSVVIRYVANETVSYTH
jgi:hypothetical protein